MTIRGVNPAALVNTPRPPAAPRPVNGASRAAAESSQATPEAQAGSSPPSQGPEFRRAANEFLPAVAEVAKTSVAVQVASELLASSATGKLSPAARLTIADYGGGPSTGFYSRPLPLLLAEPVQDLGAPATTRPQAAPVEDLGAPEAISPATEPAPLEKLGAPVEALTRPGPVEKLGAPEQIRPEPVPVRQPRPLPEVRHEPQAVENLRAPVESPVQPAARAAAQAGPERFGVRRLASIEPERRFEFAAQRQSLFSRYLELFSLTRR